MRIFHAFISLIYIGLALIGLAIIGGFILVAPLALYVLYILGIIFAGVGVIAVIIAEVIKWLMD